MVLLVYPIADEAEPPIFANPIVNGTRARVTWDHTDKGSCFSNLTFSYNITWNPVEKPQGKQSDVTEPGATEYNITNLERKTDYRVELEGFTDSDPSVYSKMAIVNFTIEGMMFACIQESLCVLIASSIQYRHSTVHVRMPSLNCAVNVYSIYIVCVFC